MNAIKLFLCGDVMTGRGIDQILANPCDPAIHEGYLQSAEDYVALAERASGAIPRRAGAAYIWGEALAELESSRPDFRIVNLETAVTVNEEWLPKGINYRMNPANVSCLSVAAIDCCALANNHVLDWGERGLVETLATLERAGIRTAGAGRNRSAAEAPAVLPLGDKGRVLVFSVGMDSSGVQSRWAAGSDRPGVDFLADLSRRSVERLARRVEAVKEPGDVVLLSIHWGGNWGYDIAHEETAFAHALVDSGCVDVVHGHSSHHPKGIEVYRDRLVLYGCGDLINDYEGIRGHEEYRGDLGLMYFPVLDADSGILLELELAATTMKRFSLQRARDADVEWLSAMLCREGVRHGTSASRTGGCHLRIAWEGARSAGTP